jgi:hypothetical protein
MSQHIKKGTKKPVHVRPFVDRCRLERVIKLVGPQSETMTAVNFPNTSRRRDSDECIPNSKWE